MITLDTEVLTPYGLIEAWKLFPGNELLDSNSIAHEIIETNESKQTGYRVELEDESSFIVSKNYLENSSLTIGDNLLMDTPVSLYKLEDSRIDFQPVLLIDGLEFGNLGKYNSIPFYYTMNTIDNRKKFFQGLMFSQLLEKYTDDNRIILLVGYKEFAEDILYLVRSLGGTGFYHQFYSNGYFYELGIQLPSYFNEGVPKREVISIEECGERDFISFETEQKELIVNSFILLNNEGELNEEKRTD